jgi:redox-sensing transcriptional repressor
MPMKVEKVSEFTTQRLSIYLRCLESLHDMGIETTSSKMMAERFNLNSAQIRKDLAYFGQFGVRGVGYVVDELRKHLATILGLNAGHRVIVVGAGHLGMALSEYRGFQKNGFSIVGVFDSSPEKIGTFSRTGVPVHDIRELNDVVRTTGASMAMIAVPAESAQDVCQRVLDAGIRAVLNFAPVRLASPQGTRIKSIDLSISLESLSYFLGITGAPAIAKEKVLNGELASSATMDESKAF